MPDDPQINIWFERSIMPTVVCLMDCVAFWFRRDLRLEDNRGLYEALRHNLPVLPVFIFDRNILDALHQKKDRRVEFIHRSLQQLKSALHPLGSDVIIQNGDPETVWKSILSTFNVKAIYANRDYESYALKRDAKIAEVCGEVHIPFERYKDHILFENHEVCKENGDPYTVFTPYKNKHRTKLAEVFGNPVLSPFLDAYPSEAFLDKFLRIPASDMPGLDKMGFEQTGASFPAPVPLINQLDNYHLHRDYPYREGTSKLGIHLRFGTISIRKLAKLALEHNETFFNELVWRDFYSMILQSFPHVEFRSFKPAYDRIEWRNNEAEFKAWCEGRTGYPMVDAGIRELNATGFMHNRLRMITASFLVKHLLIDWRWGEAYFAEKLMDFDLASNNGGWQWAAGCGTDAAPYFRIFNPQAQQERFDPNLEYVRKWIPEMDGLDYPGPIVDHKFARQRCLEVFQAALKD